MIKGKTLLGSIITTIGLSLFMGSPFPAVTDAYAVSEKDRVTEDVNSILAFADFPLDPPSSFTGANVRVEQTRDETQVFFHILTFDGSTQQEFVGGIISHDKNIFTVNKQLRTAELAETEIDLCLPRNFDFNTLECSGVVDTVTIGATWEGTGDLVRTHLNNVSHDPIFEHRHAINWQRETTAEGSLDGFEAVDNVVLGQGGSGILFYINAKCTGTEPPACEE